MKFLIVLTLFVFPMSCKQNRAFLGIDVAKKQLAEALTEKKYSQEAFVKMPVDNETEAIASIEPLLFKTYGKDRILGEKPYESCLIDGYWVINGTLPNGMMGGTFLIIFSVKDGSIIKMTHGK